MNVTISRPRLSLVLTFAGLSMTTSPVGAISPKPWFGVSTAPVRANARSPARLSSEQGKPSRSAATMIGFRKTGENSAQVYVQLTDVVEVESEQKGKTLVFTLLGVSVPRKNNRNPLVATHFNSVIERARLAPEKEDTLLIIELKRPGEASVEVTQSGHGAVLTIDVVAEGKSREK